MFEKWFRKQGPVSPKEDNPALAQAMQEVALHNTPENRNRLFSILLQTMLIVPTPELPAGWKPGFNTADGNTPVQLTVLLDKQGRKVTPVFSDLVALRNWDPNTPYVGLNARDFFKVLVTTDVQEILVNPFDPIRKIVRPGGRITRPEFAALAQGTIPAPTKPAAGFRLQPGQQFAIGIPARPPRAEALESLSSMANSMPEVRELYLFQLAAQAEGGWSHHTVIGITFTGTMSEDQMKQIVKRLGESVYGRLDTGTSLDFMVLSNGLEQIEKNSVLVFGAVELRSGGLSR